MYAYIDKILYYLREINWEGPAMFAIIFLALLAIFRKWSILLLTILTIVLAWGAGDLVITNILSQNTVISVSLLVYCIGGGIIMILILISFLKSSL